MTDSRQVAPHWFGWFWLLFAVVFFLQGLDRVWDGPADRGEFALGVLSLALAAVGAVRGVLAFRTRR